MKRMLVLLILLQATLMLADVDESCAANLDVEGGEQKGDLLLQKTPHTETRRVTGSTGRAISLTQAHTGASNDGKPLDSLFCFMLLSSQEGYEMPLVQLQVEHGVGIFECDEYQVFSNAVFTLSPLNKTHTETIESGYLNDQSLKAEIGGVWNTALNTEIFVRVWKKVFKDGRFARHGWTVKADCDTVFFPQRLREHVRSQRLVAEQGMFLKNCWHDGGMHGALEVVSHGGMKVLRDGMSRCIDANVADFKEYGEDYWLALCLEYLHVPAASDPLDLLGDTYCMDGILDGSPCLSFEKVAYHPYKDTKSYLACWNDAQRPSRPTRHGK